MMKTYRVELEVTLDEALESQAIEVARDYYSKTGGAEEPIGRSDRRLRHVPAGEFISDVRDAIMALAEANDFLKKAGVEVVGVSCGESEADGHEHDESGPAQRQQETEASDDEGAAGEADLDDFETGMYLCRWSNGDFSLVMAETRRDALVQLDEWAAGHPGQLFPMESCMLDFRLNDKGQIELNQLSEDTEGFIWETAYPELGEVRHSEAVIRPDGEYTPEGKELIRKAVERERTRLWENHSSGPESETEAGRDLQKQLGMAGPVADHFIQERARRILESQPPKKGKVN